MITKKLLMGGTAAVGSVATVANQFGKPSKTQEQLAEEALQKKIEDNREKVTSWIDENKGDGNWEINIQESNNEIKKLTEIDPGDLSSYLTEKTELLKSLTSGTETAFTFKKNENGEWENVFTKEQIASWINNAFKNKSILKLNDENKTEEISDVKKLEEFFESLENKEDLFINLKNTSKGKILFEKHVDDWKHSKTALKSWLTNKNEGNSNFEIRIKKGDDDIKTLDETDEDDLKGLMKYFFSAGEGQELLRKYKYPPKEKITLIFKKEGDKWEPIHNEETINGWIKNFSDGKASLRLYEDGKEKQLSEIKDDKELRQLFNDMTNEHHSPFKSGSKVVVFEKYAERGKNEKSWMHIQTAIWNVVSDFWGKINNLNQVEIQISDDPKDNKNAKEIEDDKLIGLLKHAHDKKEEYKNLLQNKNVEKIVFKKKEGDQWELITTGIN